MKKALVLYGKYPEIGKVKTRLAASIGDFDATLFYKLCVENIFLETKNLDKLIKPFFFYSYDSDERILDWIPSHITPVKNVNSEHVSIIKNVFKKLFDRGFDHVIITSTDVPDLNADILTAAFSALESNNIIIGSDNDGGYYILGMNKFYPEVLNITYGQGVGTYKQTIEKIKKESLVYKSLPKLYDIDIISDLKNWSKQTKRKDLEKLVKKIIKGV